jgi:hypothetical protein
MPEEVVETETKTTAKSGEKGAHERLRIVERVLFGLCGSLLLIGFFLPWVAAGALLSISGLGLVFASGEMVGMVSGSNRFMLVAVPVLGVLLLCASILGHRATRWLAVVGAGALLLFGFFIVLKLFITSTGLGMWLVIFSALASLSVGLVSVGRSARASSEPTGK